MNFLTTTEAYYARWLGDKNALNADGPRLFYSAERNVCQAGYGAPLDLYIFCRNSRAVFSYGDALRERRREFDQALADAPSPETLPSRLEALLGAPLQHTIKYVFERPLASGCGARPLRKDEYPLYRDFFLQCHPGCRDTGWLEDYFLEMASRNLCCGAFHEHTLVSCTDAPEMPYLKEQVQEIGINTLKEFRGQGFATRACAACIGEILKNGQCPMWSASAMNIASQRLAERVGFVRYAEVFTLSL